MLAWLLRLLFAVLILRLAWKFVAGLISGFRGSPATAARKRVALVRDPVCGTYLEPSRALTARSGGTTHYFCSKRCQQSFLKTA